ncbi:MAG: hypothetical protein AAFY55_13855 [Bacteroidota bacterium]
MTLDARPETAPIEAEGRACTVVRFREMTGSVLRWPRVAEAMLGDAAFRATWNGCWATDSAFMWKPIPIHPSTYDQPFFAVLVPSRFPPADSSAFGSHLDALAPDDLVASFANLGGTSRLVVPAERGDYGHLAAFCRTASTTEVDAFWREVGRYAHDAIESGHAVWCNTHGHGVPWLHVRFDPTHKYAAFPPHGPITEASQDAWYRHYYHPAFSDA